MPSDQREALRKIRTFPQLVAYLRDEMGWPIGKDDFEDLTFEYTAEELGIDPKSAAKIQKIRQLRPFVANQPWGIFFVEFEPRQLPVVALRHILGSIAVKKRATTRAAAQQMWHANDLLFVSNYGMGDERRIAFAHFAAPKLDRELPTLKVLGWDGDDTPLHLDKVAHQLITSLAYSADTPVQEWSRRWRSAFTLEHGEVIRSSKELASRLAHLASAIRRTVTAKMAIEDKNGPLRGLMESFRTALIHDLDEEGFADTYAQTITYGLLSTRIINPEGSTPDDLAGHLRTSPFLKELMEQFLKVGGRKGRAGGPGIDFDELGIGDVQTLLDRTQWDDVLRDFGDKNRDQDPVMHFFEGFLHEYDRKIKKDRGVFYTPQPVVSYIVRSVHELLQTEFGLEDGLADTTTWGEMLKKHPDLKLPRLSDDPKSPKTISPDEPFVQILDPATGTATFIVEVIDVIQRTLAAKWQQQRLTDSQQRAAWNEYVPRHLLPRLHAFELMMAPYAIAHMKIGLKLAETGYRFGAEERARIYLTNALEPWVRQLPLIGFGALAHEAAAVNDIKRHKRFTVVIGNPPYANFGQLNKIPFILDLLDDYKRGLNEKKLNLDDDFIKFVRLSQHLIDTTGSGVLGVITNNSFVDGITHRQMRQSLMGSFNQLHVLNLHGSSKKKEKAPDGSEDENVFDIQQGVATTLAVASMKRHTATVLVSDLWGKRATKYAALDKTSICSGQWKRPQLAAPYFFFADRNLDDGAEYNDYVGLKDIFMISGNGVKTERDGVSIHFTKADIESSVRDFQSLDEAALREKYETGEDSRDWTVKKAKADVMKHKGEPLYRRLLYRPFDIRHTWYSGQTRGFIGTPAFPTMRHMHEGNVAIVTTRQTAEGFDVLCTDNLIGHKSVAAYDINTAFPLYMFEDALGLDLGYRQASSSSGSHKRPNFSAHFLKVLAAALLVPQGGNYGLPVGLTSEDIFHYAYAVLHSLGYRSRYAEFLKIDFPRLPLTGSLELFRALARVGSELTALHLLESPKLAQPLTGFLGGHHSVIEKPSWSRNTVWVDKAQTTGFEGVREDVWNLHIGGYQVCEKWLKDRKGRTLSRDDIGHYQKIVVAISETIRLMKEIDEVIEQHGGWPGAFQASDSAATTTERVLRVAEPPAEYGPDQGEDER